MIITTFAGGEKRSREYFVAKNGSKSLVRFDYGNESETAIVSPGPGEHFVLDVRARTARRVATAGGGNDLIRSLTVRWLNEKTDAIFEKLPSENGLVRFRITWEGNADSEMIIYVDRRLNLPVKQEMFYRLGGSRKLGLRYELKDFKREAPEALFVVPKDYKVIER